MQNIVLYIPGIILIIGGILFVVMRRSWSIYFTDLWNNILKNKILSFIFLGRKGYKQKDVEILYTIGGILLIIVGIIFILIMTV